MTMSTNSIPFPTAVNPSKSSHVTMADTQPQLEIQTVRDLVQELTQLPFRSFDGHDDLDHIRFISQSVARYLHHLGYYFNTPVDISGGDTLGSGYGSRDATHPLSSSDIKDTGKAQTDQPTAAAHQQIVAQDQAVSGDAAPPPAIIEPDREQQCRHHWCELGDFFVSFGFTVDETGKKRFQTRVHHSQADRSAQWSGLAIGQLLTWMLHQTNLLPPAEGKITPGSKPDRAQALSAPVMTSGPIGSQTINPSPQESSQPLSIQPLPHRPMQPAHHRRPQSSPVSFINFLMILYTVARLKNRRT
jgi:hypothetical protein